MNSSLYNKLGLSISNLILDTESKEYKACRYNLNDLKIIDRKAKITPKKVGQFVTCWKRNQEGITTPFNESDDFDYYVINVTSGAQSGQFVFPKAILIKKGIVSTNSKDGKRGFRVYPEWDKPTNKQAISTQKWQLSYFLDLNDSSLLKKAKELYKG